MTSKTEKKLDNILTVLESFVSKKRKRKLREEFRQRKRKIEKRGSKNGSR